MKRLDTFWVAAACVAAFTVVIGLALVRRTSAPPIYLTAPTSQPEPFKFNADLPAEFRVPADVGPATKPATVPILPGAADTDQILLPVD